MDASTRNLVRGLKKLILEIECGKLDRMTKPEYKLFLDGLSLIVEAKKSDYEHRNNTTKRSHRFSYWTWLYSLLSPKTKADGSGHGGFEPEKP